jgi:ribonucleotide reductase beta subunit family protein with ferritin-like domain
VEVNDNYMERYSRVFRPTEIKMMLASFSNMETIHIAAYALLLETIGMPDSEFSAFTQYKEMKDKHDYMQKFGVETDADILRTVAMFGAFTEGLQLFASFAMLMNFPRFNKMKGMGQIVSWSVRDESAALRGHDPGVPHAGRRDGRADGRGEERHHRVLPHGREDGGRLHRPRLLDGPGAGDDGAGHQELHPLHRRLAPGAAQAARHLWRERAPDPVAVGNP